MIVSLLYKATRKLLSPPSLLLRGDEAKDAGLLVLRHENAVLRRQLPAGCLDQQQPACLRDGAVAVTRHPQARVETDTLAHLESASSRCGNRDLDNPHSRWSGALFA